MRDMRFLAALAAALFLVSSGCGSSDKPDNAKSSGGSTKAAQTNATKASEQSATPVAPAAGKAIDVSYIGPDVFAAIVVRPKQIEDSPAVGGTINDLISGFSKMFGFQPGELGPTEVQALLSKAVDPQTKRMESAAVVVHFAQEIDVKHFLTSFHKMGPGADREITQDQVAGKPCYVLFAFNRPFDQVAYSPDPKTVVICERRTLEKILAGIEPKGPLVDRLKKVDAKNDVVAAFDFEGYPDLAKELDDAKQGAAPLLKTYLDAAKTLRGGTLSLNLKGGSLLEAVLDAKDASAADDIENLVDQGLTMAKGGLGTLKTMVAQEQQEAAAPAFKLGDELLAGAKFKKSGTQVAVAVRRPESMDSALPKLVALAKDTVTAARGAAQRTSQMNNLKQIALAMILYADRNTSFPPAASEKDGKPLLSWRVAILPYLEEKALYDQFHLDEPWDSPHNMEVAKKHMPRVYQSSGYAGDGKTSMLVFTGKDAAFDGGKKFGMADIRDGMSNTIMVVEAGPDKAVFWTKPDDIPFDPQKPLAALGKIAAEGFHAAFFDGSVRRLKIDDAMLKALITPAGGEILPNK